LSKDGADEKEQKKATTTTNQSNAVSHKRMRMRGEITPVKRVLRRTVFAVGIEAFPKIGLQLSPCDGLI
jgi:hypothetical protein